MLANDRREKYEEFWKEFGRQIASRCLLRPRHAHAEWLRDLLLFGLPRSRRWSLCRSM